ncbi:hypothetical protein [Dermatobacter hominis]|uniref:hypothetical protein n=1 Tax=Dermatobacter hominis TaxID=2884263 RepID=UPI001D12FE37|nr:hypothetical protein [Dermatobacter hominis]UDY37197.1 hypothetical protein LH044_06575 [Dermatobacter hominis]
MFRTTSDRTRPARHPQARHQPAAPTARLEGDRLVVEGPRIADVLAVVHQHVGAGATLLRTDRTIVGGIGGFFGREHFVVEADASALVADVAELAEDAAAPADAGPDPDVAAPVTGQDGTGAPPVGDDFAAHLARALRDAEPAGPSDEELVARLQGLLVDDPAPTIATARTRSEEPVEAPAPDLAARAAAPDTSGAEAAPAATAPEPAPVAGTFGGAELDARLALLTLAAPGLDACELAGRVDVLRTAPPSPVERGIVAVVGERDEAMAVAGRLCTEDGASADDVIVVAPEAPAAHPAWMWVGSPDEAAARRDRWNRRPGRSVVAVLLPPGDDARRWARAALDALAPAEVRLAVPGWRAADEVVGRRLHGLAPVDGIELVGDVDPATAVGFLTSDVPVVGIDGEPATAERWAELLRSVAGAPDSGPGSAAAPRSGTVSSAAADPALR